MPRGIYDHGHIVPWNKGLKGAVLVSEETRAKLRAKRAGRRPGLGRKMSDEEKAMRRVVAKNAGCVPPSHKGVVWSPEVRARMSAAQRRCGYMQTARGYRAPNWKGGITNPNRIARTSKAFREWREAVFSRDDWTCQKCKSRGVHLHPHHILGFATHIELRFEVDNGLTLCRKCHMGLHRLLRQAAQTPAT